jgi:5-methylcytosine-specific restriction protein B
MSSGSTRGSNLEIAEIAQYLVDSLGGSVKWHSDTDITVREAINVHLKPPLPDRNRFYLFNLIWSSREEEYKINTRLPDDRKSNRYAPDRSDGYFILVGGYNEEADIWAFWDDSLRETYSSNPSIQVDEATVEKAESEGFAVQDKDRADGETAVVVKSDQLDEGIKLRYRLIRNRRILDDLLHEDWRDSGALAQTVERIVDVVLEETDPDRPMSERRKEAVRQVATERGNSPSTVRGKLKGDLFPDRQRGSDGYIPSHFDPLLRDVEAAVRTESEDIESDFLNHIEEVETETAIHVVSLPPEDWIVACYYNSIPFAEDEEDDQDSIDEDDLLIFHLNDDSETLDGDDYETGIIGGAIVQTHREKEEPRWQAEYDDDADYPDITEFKRVFYTGSPGKLKLQDSINDKDQSTVEDETHHLTENLYDEDKADEILGVSFPSGNKIQEIGRGETPLELEPARELVKQLAKRVSEAPSVNIFADYDARLDGDELFNGLHLPGQKEEIKSQVNSALRTGKHIIFTGPPGTGKTEIASNVAKEMEDQRPWQFSGYRITTATSDWSTFDTLGGYMPEEGVEGGDQLKFNSGILLNRLKNDRTLEQRNEPIVIDELNRANIDEAFGQLFTVLSGESVQLQYTRDGEELEIVTADSLKGLPDANQFAVPESWRILATMNTFDKNSLYEMSYAFMRRFSFISVNGPFQEGEYEGVDELESLMEGYDDYWETGAGSDELRTIGRIWKATNEAIDSRAIGPAIVKDMLKGVVEMTEDGLGIEEAATSVVMNYIFPQLEGVRGRDTVVKKIIETEEVDKERLTKAAKDRLNADPFSDDG